MKTRHYSVLLREILTCYEGRDIRFFVDGTLGAGGHAEGMLNAHPEIELYIGIDQDPEALQIARERLSPWKEKMQFIHGNFEDLSQYLTDVNAQALDGILLDIGVSSMQLDQSEKGFSFMRDGPLDMRMDPTQGRTAADIINTGSEAELGKIFKELGEEKRWRAAARAIVRSRESQPILTTKQLVEVLNPVLFSRNRSIHPSTLVFQALRIYVNRELEVLQKALPLAIDSLRKGGRLCVISFHSLEDRIVKNILRYEASDKIDPFSPGGVFLDKEPRLKIITSKPIVASVEEVSENPRSRSAKLRIAEKL